MANSMYAKGLEGFLDGSIDWDTDSIKAVLVDDAAYTVNLATDQFLSDIPSGARIATSSALATKTVVGGVADAADTTLTAVTGATVERIVLFKDSGVAGTSRLILSIDTGTNLPVTPNGGDITVQWDNGANKIFKL